MKKNMLIFVSGGIVILAVLLFTVLGCQKSETKPGGFITIGLTMPLTGDLGAWGERALKGAQLATQEVNAHRAEGSKFRLLVEDTKTLPAVGVSVLQKLIDVNKVKYVVSDPSSGVTLAMAPVAEKNKVILLAPGASNSDVRNAGEYVFRDWTSDDYDGIFLARAAKDTLHAATVLVFHQDNAYSQGLAAAFNNAASKLGIHVVVTERFSGTVPDYRTLLTKYKDAKVDTFFVAAHAEQSARFFIQARELGIKLPFLGCVAVEGPEFSKTYPDANGIYYTTVPLIPERNPKFADFAKRYKAAYGTLPDVAAAHAYDAILLLDHAIPSASTSVEEARQNLLAVKDFPGATGKMTFDEKGDVKKPVALMRYDHGKPVFLETFNP